MKNILKISTLLFVLLVGSNFASAQAQKFGYLNSQELILLLPESKAADSELESYQKQLAAAFEKKVATFQADVATFEKAASTTLSKVQAEEQGAALQKRQQDLQQEEYNSSQKLSEKRNELLKPILEKIDTAIKAVGKEGNYTMIFDSSGMNVMLFNQPKDDVMPQVKAKLGL